MFVVVVVLIADLNYLWWWCVCESGLFLRGGGGCVRASLYLFLVSVYIRVFILFLW